MVRLIFLLLLISPLVQAQHSPPPVAKIYSFTEIKETVSSGAKMQATLKVRFDCEPMRYSAWIESTEPILETEIEIRYDQRSFKMWGKARRPTLLVLEDSNGVSEGGLIEKIKKARSLTVIYKFANTEKKISQFFLGTLIQQLADGEELCSKFTEKE